jgi:hypothetical protein
VSTTPTPPPPPTPPYDLWLQYQATAIDHCLKLGGVVIDPSPKAGFAK